MKNRSQDSDDIERAVYDGMQDLRAPRVPVARPQPKNSRKSKRKRRPRR